MDCTKNIMIHELRKNISGFFLDPEVIKILSLGAILKLLIKEQGSSELISGCGAQRACL